MTALIKTPEQSGAAKKRPLLNEIGEGLTYIRGNSLVLVLLLVGLATTLLSAPFMSLLPVFVVDVYDRGPDSMGLLVAAMGAGALVGSLAVAAMGVWRRGILLMVGAFSTGAALTLVAALPYYTAAAVIMLLMGLGDAGPPHRQHGPDNGGLGRPLPRQGHERLHDELRPDAPGRAARRSRCGCHRGKGRYGNPRSWADSRRGLYPRDPEKVTGVELGKKKGVRSCARMSTPPHSSHSLSRAASAASTERSPPRFLWNGFRPLQRRRPPGPDSAWMRGQSTPLCPASAPAFRP